MSIDLSSLKKGIGSLSRTIAVALSREKMQALDKDQQDAIRAGVIQNFEFTYELCWKMLKRQLEEKSPSPAEIDQLSFRDMIRVGAEKGIIADVEKWFEYRRIRNITSHTYDEEKAESVFNTAIEFIHDAKHLLIKLEERND